MELRTQAIDRVLEALAPTLSAELDRIINEAQQNLEAEFQKKLQMAIREAEAASQRVAEVQLEQAVSETQAAVRKQVTEDLQTQFTQTLQETTAQLRAEFDAERSQLSAQLDEWRLFADAQRQLGEAGSQSEMLVRFLKLAERFAPSIAVYVSKPDGLALWKHRGETAFPPIVSHGTIDPGLFFSQITVRDKLVAAVCAAQPYKVEGLNFLTASLERAIETFGMKLRTPLPRPAAHSEPTPAQAASEKMHGEARELARLLVSEIKLFNEQAVRDGRANSDLYLRLQNEIETGREQYRQRTSSAVLATDYFHEEIVRVLADNDPTRLGGSYPGPKSS